MPKKSRAQEAALGRNLEPLYTALVPACCLHLAQSHGWEQIEITVDSNAGTVWDMDGAKNVVYTGEVVTKCRRELYSQKNPIPKDISGSIGFSKMASETSVLLLEDGDGDRMFIVMHETFDYAISIVLRRLTAIQGMTDVGLDLRFNLQHQSRSIASRVKRPCLHVPEPFSEACTPVMDSPGHSGHFEPFRSCSEAILTSLAAIQCDLIEFLDILKRVTLGKKLCTATIFCVELEVFYLRSAGSAAPLYYCAKYHRLDVVTSNSEGSQGRSK
ncbi:hypothetical protein B0H13DRAFT_1853369 [Mycena leptocephala]|nr:hypothetical protein B0H13DRAFT_1853369 [Mycena leptocephala]